MNMVLPRGVVRNPCPLNVVTATFSAFLNWSSVFPFHLRNFRRTNMKNYGYPMVMVIEHLQCSMSNDLLCKFPDNSAFDFDYTQSSIWSPLVPRPLSSASNRRLSSGLSRKLSYDDVSLGCTNFNKVTAKIKRKLSNAVTENMREYHSLKKRKKKEFEFTRLPSSSNLTSTTPTPRKGWVKVLKAATKHFKKKKNKKIESTVDVNFCKSLTENSLVRTSTYP